MSLFKYFSKNGPEPTDKEKEESESFKQILKYGNDIGGRYKDIAARYDAIEKEKRKIVKECEKAIVKQRKIKLKKIRGPRYNWNTIYLREYTDCGRSPLGICVTMLEYGSSNPFTDDPQNCFYCNKEYK